MHEIFGPSDDEKAEADVVPQIGTNSISTNLFEISFKEHKIGDNVIDGGNNYLANNIISAMLNQLCMDIGRLTYRLESLIFGDEAVGKKESLRPTKCFDEFTLKENYAKNLTAKQRMFAETMYAELVTYWLEGKSLLEQYQKLRPAPKQPPQCMWVSRDVAAALGVDTGRVTDYNIAIDYRVRSNKDRLVSERRFKDEAAGFSQLSAMGKII